MSSPCAIGVSERIGEQSGVGGQSFANYKVRELSRRPELAIYPNWAPKIVIYMTFWQAQSQHRPESYIKPHKIPQQTSVCPAHRYDDSGNASLKPTTPGTALWENPGTTTGRLAVLDSTLRSLINSSVRKRSWIQRSPSLPLVLERLAVHQRPSRRSSIALERDFQSKSTPPRLGTCTSTSDPQSHTTTQDPNSSRKTRYVPPRQRRLSYTDPIDIPPVHDLAHVPCVPSWTVEEIATLQEEEHNDPWVAEKYWLRERVEACNRAGKELSDVLADVAGAEWYPSMPS
ncbi:hypothetical protein B0H16DRAFT_1687240 [Mycena metata]|uniref:Uncharacterized protein n=1 Tax=Mycena metata TaxID=1033252 RepID=A0AAD7JII5_9AGAR|nr:hypothetical protein B0H16DRAFT_1687240 [Mycena metata]